MAFHAYGLGEQTIVRTGAADRRSLCHHAFTEETDVNTKLAWLAGAVAMMACQPPPEIAVAGGPSIEILFPPALNDAGDGPFVLPSNGDGTWSTVVVVDIDNFTIVDPYISENEGIVREGEGHWHLLFEGHEEPTIEAFHPMVLDGLEDGVEAGDTVTLVANLRQNDHSKLQDENGADVDDTLEFELGE